MLSDDRLLRVVAGAIHRRAYAEDINGDHEKFLHHVMFTVRKDRPDTFIAPASVALPPPVPLTQQPALLGKKEACGWLTRMSWAGMQGVFPKRIPAK